MNLKRGKTYNTDHSPVLGDIVRLNLLDEAQGKEKGKEADEAEAQGPAPRSTLHVESCVRNEKKKKKPSCASASRRATGPRSEAEKEWQASMSTGALFSNLSYRLLEKKESKIPASGCEVVGGTGERKQDGGQVQPF